MKPSSEPGSSIIGQVIGDRYRLIEFLGEGGSGRIYKAKHVSLAKDVAVKILHEHLAQDELAVERFRREATTVSSLNNPHLTQILDFARLPDGRLYMVMEFLEGESLDEVIRRSGALHWERAVEIAGQVAEVLMEAHATGYLHRDLRPRNVFLTRQKNGKEFVKLLDFGLAKLVETEGAAYNTTLGMTFGDPRYMSPEQAKGASLDRRSDLYSLGCVLYEMLTATPPFTGERVFDILSQHIEKEPPTMDGVDAPSWLKGVIHQCLAKTADERPITALALKELFSHHEEEPQREEPVLSGEVSIAEETAAKKLLKQTAPGLAVSPGELETPAVGIVNVQEIPEEKKKITVPLGKADNTPLSAESEQVAPLPRVEPRDSVVKDDWFAGDEEYAANFKADSFDDLGASEEFYYPRKRRKGLLWAAFLAAGLLCAGVIVVASLGGGAIDKKKEDVQLEETSMADTSLSGETTGQEPEPGPEPGINAKADTPKTDASTQEKSSPKKTSTLGTKASSESKKNETNKSEKVTGSAPKSAADLAKDLFDEPTTGNEPGKPVGGNVEPPEERPPAEVSIPPAPTTDVSEPPAEPQDPYAESRQKAQFFAGAGYAKLNASEFAAAEELFKKALAQSPGHFDAQVGLAELALKRRQYAKAKSNIEKALGTRSTARALTILGESQLALGNAAGALVSFKTALKKNPDYSRARDGYLKAEKIANPPEDEILE